VTIEFHHRILHGKADSSILTSQLKTTAVSLDAGPTVLIPDPATRLLHNFLHAQITNRQAVRRALNLRQLLEFAALSAHFKEHLAPDALPASLQRRRLPLLAEYWAQAERWFGAPYPNQLPRSVRQKRELWLAEAVFASRKWFFAFFVMTEIARAPRRAGNICNRLLMNRGYFIDRLRSFRK